MHCSRRFLIFFLTIVDYFTNLKKIWDKLDNIKQLPTCECADYTCNLCQKVQKVQQDHRLMMFLMKLTNEYVNVRSHILMMEVMPNLPQA